MKKGKIAFFIAFIGLIILTTYSPSSRGVEYYRAEDIFNNCRLDITDINGNKIGIAIVEWTRSGYMLKDITNKEFNPFLNYPILSINVPLNVELRRYFTYNNEQAYVDITPNLLHRVCRYSKEEQRAGFIVDGGVPQQPQQPREGPGGRDGSTPPRQDSGGGTPRSCSEIEEEYRGTEEGIRECLLAGCQVTKKTIKKSIRTGMGCGIALVDVEVLESCISPQNPCGEGRWLCKGRWNIRKDVIEENDACCNSNQIFTFYDKKCFCKNKCNEPEEGACWNEYYDQYVIYRKEFVCCNSKTENCEKKDAIISNILRKYYPSRNYDLPNGAPICVPKSCEALNDVVEDDVAELCANRPDCEFIDGVCYRKLACSNTLDDDGDSKIDFNGGPNNEPRDPGCFDARDDDEVDSAVPVAEEFRCPPEKHMCQFNQYKWCCDKDTLRAGEHSKCPGSASKPSNNEQNRGLCYLDYDLVVGGLWTTKNTEGRPRNF